MARTVVLCGALGLPASMWEPQLPALEGLDVVLVDHPGHGGEPPAEVEDVSDLARRLLAQVDAARFSFVGASLGGAVGMRLALDAPERVERLALLSTSARFGPPEVWRERAALVRAEGLEAVVDAALERWFTPSFAGVQRVREQFLTTDAESYARCCDALARWDARAELPAVRAATLCIAAADDPSTPPEHAREIAEAIPGARCEVVERARHLVGVERPGEVNRLLAGFLAG